MFVLLYIAGAASGIGRAVCQVLARDGARVIATDRNVEGAKGTTETLQGSISGSVRRLECVRRSN